MAIDQTPSSSAPESPTVSAIENEFAAYRAISSGAILSLVLGLVSVFCYASLWFLAVVAASVVFGLISLRSIRRLPDVLTGTVFARIGIGIALLFGLTAVTQQVAEDVMANLDASRFAKHYVEVIKNEPVSMALWYQQQPDYRQSKSPDEIVDELKKSKGKSADPYKDRAGALLQIKERLQGKGESIRFARIETKVVNGLTVYANALLDLDGPGSKEFPEKEQFALLQMIKGPKAGKFDWVIEEVKFPYTPASAIATVKHADDDGHGHGH